MQTAAGRASRRPVEEALEAIERFLKASSQPVLIEPGEEPLPITADCMSIEQRSGVWTIQCWSDSRNLVRRITGLAKASRGRLEITVEQFPKREGVLTLVDLAEPANSAAPRRGARLKLREVLRRFLRRQYPSWRLTEVSAEQDLEHSLSAVYPRAMLKQGTRALAAIAAPADAPDGALSFGLIWLDYLRRRESRLGVEGLAMFLPAGGERNTCLRVQHLDPSAARFEMFLYSEDGVEQRIDPADYNNIDTRLPACCQALAQAPPQIVEWTTELAGIDGVERRDRGDGSVSLGVRGLEFARAAPGGLAVGIDTRRPAHNTGEARRIALQLVRMRSSEAADRSNPLYRRHPEAWLESEIRRDIEKIEASLVPGLVYGQVPEVTAAERGVIDLLAVDRAGRLVVIEIKASEDLHLPVQALDYWIRVKWHLERGEFRSRGYFPGIPVSSRPPRLLLVAPALDFHPAIEAVLRFFPESMDVERIGVGVEWRKELRVIFRKSGCRSGSFET